MKKALICAFVFVLFTAVSAVATIYTVDLGATDVVSDSGITLSDWGQAESGGGDVGRPVGTYGGIGVGNCRVAWGNLISGDDNDYATITFPEDIVSVTIRHLNGSVFDSFNVSVDGVFWGDYTGEDGDEEWFIHSFSGTAGKVLLLDLTTGDEGWHDTWGQLAIDCVTATTPEPATLCLLGLGGLLLRRKR
jgi:hypothetical protein